MCMLYITTVYTPCQQKFERTFNMPSTAPKIVIYTTEDIIKKLDEIAKEQNRSRANLCETIIKDYLTKYNK